MFLILKFLKILKVLKIFKIFKLFKINEYAFLVLVASTKAQQILDF